MLNGLTKRDILLFAAVLLVGGVLSAGFNFWLGRKYIDHLHAGDPLQATRGLVPAQDVRSSRPAE